MDWLTKNKLFYITYYNIYIYIYIVLYIYILTILYYILQYIYINDSILYITIYINNSIWYITIYILTILYDILQYKYINNSYDILQYILSGLLSINSSTHDLTSLYSVPTLVEWARLLIRHLVAATLFLSLLTRRFSSSSREYFWRNCGEEIYLISGLLNFIKWHIAITTIKAIGWILWN